MQFRYIGPWVIGNKKQGEKMPIVKRYTCAVWPGPNRSPVHVFLSDGSIIWRLLWNSVMPGGTRTQSGPITGSTQS